MKIKHNNENIDIADNTEKKWKILKTVILAIITICFISTVYTLGSYYISLRDHDIDLSTSSNVDNGIAPPKASKANVTRHDDIKAEKPDDAAALIKKIDDTISNLNNSSELVDNTSKENLANYTKKIGDIVKKQNETIINDRKNIGELSKKAQSNTFTISEPLRFKDNTVKLKDGTSVDVKINDNQLRNIFIFSLVSVVSFLFVVILLAVIFYLKFRELCLSISNLNNGSNGSEVTRNAILENTKASQRIFNILEERLGREPVNLTKEVQDECTKTNGESQNIVSTKKVNVTTPPKVTAQEIVQQQDSRYILNVYGDFSSDPEGKVAELQKKLPVYIVNSSGNGGFDFTEKDDSKKYLWAIEDKTVKNLWLIVPSLSCYKDWKMYLAKYYGATAREFLGDAFDIELHSGQNLRMTEPCVAQFDETTKKLTVKQKGKLMGVE